MKKATDETVDARLFRSCAEMCRLLAERFDATADGAWPQEKLRELASKSMPVLLNATAPTEVDRRAAEEWRRRAYASARSEETSDVRSRRRR